MCAKWITYEEKFQMWHMSSYEKCNTVVHASTVLFVVIYYTYLYILFMTILFALVNYWFNSFRWHSFSIEFVFIFRSRLCRIARTHVSPLSHITCLHGFILICKQECFAAYFTTIRDFSPSFISFCIYNVSSGDILAFAEYLRYGYYLTVLSYIAGRRIDHPALLFALRFILCQTGVWIQ